MRRTLSERLAAKVVVDPESGCHNWTGCVASTKNSTRQGYGHISDGSRKLQVKHGVHRLSYEQNIGPIPEGLCVCHKCDNSLCVNPEHLFVGSYADNNKDMRAKGRNSGNPVMFGFDNPATKLTEAQKIKIKKLTELGKNTLQAIADQFGVSKGLVWQIKTDYNARA